MVNGEAHRRAVKKYYLKHRELGLCLRCSVPAVDGHSLCAKHQDQKTLKNDRRAKRRVQQGKCRYCNREAERWHFCHYHFQSHFTRYLERMIKLGRSVNRQMRCKICNRLGHLQATHEYLDEPTMRLAERLAKRVRKAKTP